MCFRAIRWCVSGCALMLALLTLPGRAADRPAGQERFTLAPGQERVLLSLRVLASRVSKAQAANEPLPEDYRNLAGIGVVEGFLVAEHADPDVILVGRKSPSRPSLRLDYLVVSLRCAGQGQHPYCSLDPQPENIRALQDLSQRAGRPKSLAEMKAQFEKMKNAIGPQDVIVGGVPRNSRHGRIMIAADYHMKKVSQGLVRVPDVVSCLDRSIQEAKARFEKDGTLSTSGTSMARFWFHVAAGGPTFSEEEGVVWLDTCSVVVLTEQQKAAASGKLHDVQQEDPQARAFAREFSSAFPKLTSQVPVYAELENLYRLYAVVLAMARHGVLDKLGLDCNSYLAGYRYAEEKPLPATLPGLANSQEFSHRFKQGNREGEYVLFPMVCGGVGMDMRADKESFGRAPDRRLSVLRTAALSARPSRDALAWPLPPGKGPVNQQDVIRE
ncbi:MAG: DUF1598 domain-containing protein [Planctomycetota bacterium]|nr:DUF1598 domain-containing protein [Planctomycetota bacterium]